MKKILTMTALMTVLVTTGFSGHGYSSVVDEAPAANTLDATDFVTKLALIQGHLWVAAELVDADRVELGAKHAKHPAQEVYQELVPYFRATNTQGFAPALEAMSAHFQSGSLSKFRRSYLETMDQINEISNEQGLSSANELMVAKALIDQALIEYRVGVIDGEILDLQEYQDARGFLAIAKGVIEQAAKGKDREFLLEQVEAAQLLWPSLDPKGRLRVGDTALASLADSLAETLANLQAQTRE